MHNNGGLISHRRFSSYCLRPPGVTTFTVSMGVFPLEFLLLGDGGTYTCRAINEHGEHFVMAEVSVKGLV